MHIDKTAKGVVSVVLIACAVCTLSACFNLGNGTTGDDDYREAYSAVKLIGSDSSVENYSMSDFYSKDTVNKFDCPIAAENRSEYAYVVISVGRNLKLGEVDVFFDSDKDVDLSVTFFVSDDYPTKIYNGEEGRYDADECDEPEDDALVGNASAKLTKNKWKSIRLERWTDPSCGTAKRLSVAAGQYLILRIDNNTYSVFEREYESVKKEIYELQKNLDDKKAVWQELVDNSASDNEIAAAKSAVDTAQDALDAGMEKQREVETRHSSDKDGGERANIRMTNILIYAERE